MQIEHTKKKMLWRTMNGEVLVITEMKTGHLFNSVKMVYNHMAELIGFPTFWFSNKYESHTKRWIEDPEGQLNTLKQMVEELETRLDWDSEHRASYRNIRLTLSGGFHKIVFDKLESMGLNSDMIQLRDPLTLLLEAKEKYERKQLNSNN
tara:strand:+ start:240 stop:689 length:450 start_codon:yes stop_codon:yes gene_type:complete